MTCINRLHRHHRALSALLIALTMPLPAATPNSSPTTAMSSQPEYTLVQVPARIANLGFSYLRPTDFHVVPLPDETPNFEDPTKFLPLQMAMAGYGAVLFTVAARPAYENGTIEDWAEYLAREGGTQIQSIQEATFAGMPALRVEAVQDCDMGPMRIRTMLLEDGGRMLNLSILAPQSIWPSVEPLLQGTLSSFRLADVRGSSVPLTRAAAKQAEEKAALVAQAAAPAEAEEQAEEEPAASTPATAAELALADDPKSLDEEHPFNVRLRDNGAGLTPRVLETYGPEKYALVGSGAIVAGFHVPFGWHVIDDGRRVLIFDADGKIQINLDLRRDNGDHRGLLEHVLAENQRQQPRIDPEFVDFTPEMPGLVLRNYRDGDDVLVQAFIVKQLRDDGLSHVARVTAAPEDMTRAMNLAEFVLRSLNFESIAAAR
jgi:hypothetical protein